MLYAKETSVPKYHPQSTALLIKRYARYSGCNLTAVTFHQVHIVAPPLRSSAPNENRVSAGNSGM